MENTLDNIKSLWKSLGNVCVDEDGNIEENFLHFQIGTDREEIWDWFEETFNIRVVDLMFPNQKL